MLQRPEPDRMETGEEARAELARVTTEVAVSCQVEVQVVQGLPLPVYRYTGGVHRLLLPCSARYRRSFWWVTALLMRLSERLDQRLPRKEPLRTELLFVLLYGCMVPETQHFSSEEIRERRAMLERVVRLECDQECVGAVYAEELAALLDILHSRRRYARCQRLAAILGTAGS